MKLKPSTVSFALAGLTFALVVLGGIVHNTGSSLACPDWPLCNGTAFPRMAGAVLIEHGHRLTALAVTLGTLALVALLAARRDHNLWLACVALGLVIVQALLGAITVKYRLPPAVSTAHLGTSMLFFSTVIWLGFRLRQNAAPPARLQRWTAAAAALVYAQMVLGAAVRHLGAGLVCRELVSCSGWTGGDLTLKLHMLHRIVAVAVLIVVSITSVQAFRAADRGRKAERSERGPSECRAGGEAARLPALLAPLLVVAQMTLGLLTITTFRDIVPLTAHLGVAALLLADLLTLHLAAPRKPASSDDDLPVAVTA